MANYHGGRKTKNYFEGWYFKHQSEDMTIAMIPGIQMDAAGHKSAFIQAITQSDSWNFTFPFSEFSASKSKLAVKIGLNLFSENGIWVDISQNGMSIKGKIVYGDLTPIAYNIMGPFSFLPFMECNHAVCSLYHSTRGTLQVDGRPFNFSGGRGYIEQDWGRSFPKKYTWLQTNDFQAEKACLFVSIAQIPFLGRTFTGCICILYFNRKEYRLASYLGVKIIEWNQSGILLKQGKYTLQITVQNSSRQKLLAPTQGELSRTIHESASCRVHIAFNNDGRPLFEQTSEAASFEYVESTEKKQ